MKLALKKSILAASCMVVMSAFALPFLPNGYKAAGTIISILYWPSLIVGYLNLITMVIGHVARNPELDDTSRVFWILISFSGFWACVYYLLYFRYPELSPPQPRENLGAAIGLHRLPETPETGPRGKETGSGD